jgi:hypothetical protein
MKAVLREPLLHFLLLGAALFPGYAFLNRESERSEPQTIVVDRDELLSFLQYRSRAFDAARFSSLLDSLSKEDLQRLIDDYVRQEALHREARALQLDKNDYVARLRLIQQLEFVMRGLAEADLELSSQQIKGYYEAHRQQYQVNPRVTFAHVFFSRDRHGAERAHALARAALRRFNHGRVRFDRAPSYGDRFLYHVNYVQREAGDVTSHFGEAMQVQLFALQPSDRTWYGPFESPYGFHLVMLTRNDPGYLPPLEDVQSRVEQDARQALLDERLEHSIQSVIDAYEVKVEPLHKASAADVAPALDVPAGS